MTRIAAAMATLLSSLAPASATTTAIKNPLTKPAPEYVRLPAPPAPKAPAPPVELAIGDATEVVLDGRPCDYKDIPANATVVRVEVGSDRTTVRRIEFRRTK